MLKLCWHEDCFSAMLIMRLKLKIMKNREPVESARRLDAEGVFVRRFLLLACLLVGGLGISCQAQHSLNVTNYGAIGDAVQFFVNTSSNAVVFTTTNQIPNSAIGEAIEIFGAGVPTTSVNNQDMVATITNIVNGTNIYVSQRCGKSLTNAFATYGHNNTPNFQSAIAAVGNDTNDFINIPAGKYLLLTINRSGVYGYSSIVISQGGINFVGAGANSTTLLSQGAWTLIGGSTWRGFLVEVHSPITNNFPVSFANLTMDGGVQQGNTSNHGFPASIIDGTGWDETHDAFLLAGVAATNLYHTYFTNVNVTHWRGEEFKSIDGSRNGHIGIYNCMFSDGNATALNVYPVWDVRSNLFVNMFQIAEYYQAYSLSTSYFEYNTASNITGNGFAVNGGTGINPPFIIASNVFYFSQANGIETVPADNLFITGNLFSNVGNYVISFDIGAAGYQGTYFSSNVVIAANTIVNPYIFVELGGGAGPTDPQSVVSVTVSSNVMLNPSGNLNFLQSYGGWTTNISFRGNNCSQFINTPVYMTSASPGSPYPFIGVDNLCWTPISTSGASGSGYNVSYISGSRFKLSGNYSTNMIIYLDDTNGSEMPAGAQILFTNSTSNSKPVPVIPSCNLQTPPVAVPYGQTSLFYWLAWNNSWSTNAALVSGPGPLDPPPNFRPNY